MKRTLICLTVVFVVLATTVGAVPRPAGSTLAPAGNNITVQMPD